MNRLAQIRQSRELDIEELARGAGIAEFELNWIERGGIARLSDAIRLIQFFGCRCDEIFPETEDRRETFERIIKGQIPSKLYRELDWPEFDTDPRYWFLCVRIGGLWRRIFIRSGEVRRIRSVLNVDRDSFLLVESCGNLVALNCQHVAAYEIVSRAETDWINPEPLQDGDLSVLFLDSPQEQKFEFESHEALVEALDTLEFKAPSVEPYIEFDDADRFVGLAPEGVAMMRISMENILDDGNQ